ncbi:hypothetical protein XELAEV_18028814mg, partial [Xenopus laevis]
RQFSCANVRAFTSARDLALTSQESGSLLTDTAISRSDYEQKAKDWAASRRTDSPWEGDAWSKKTRVMWEKHTDSRKPSSRHKVGGAQVPTPCDTVAPLSPPIDTWMLNKLQLGISWGSSLRL